MLQGFFYDLMRDHLPAGVVEKLVQENETHADEDIAFSNPALALYAQQLAARLGGGRAIESITKLSQAAEPRHRKRARA